MFLNFLKIIVSVFHSVAVMSPSTVLGSECLDSRTVSGFAQYFILTSSTVSGT